MLTGFDALTHLNHPSLRGRVADVLSEAANVGVGGAMVAGWDPEGWDAIVALGEASPLAYALGVHPWKATTSDVVGLLDRYQPPVVGEIGLDHFVAKSDEARAVQRALFRDQLAWARAHERPVIIHAVRAVPEVLHILQRDGLGTAGGMIHGWHLGPDIAEQAVRLGLHLSIGPAILRRSADKILSAVVTIPPSRLLLETDSPEQKMPDGRPIMPHDLVSIAEAVSRTCRRGVDRVLAETGKNARRLFAFDPQGR